MMMMKTKTATALERSMLEKMRHLIDKQADRQVVGKFRCRPHHRLRHLQRSFACRR